MKMNEEGKNTVYIYIYIIFLAGCWSIWYITRGTCFLVSSTLWSSWHAFWSSPPETESGCAHYLRLRLRGPEVIWKFSFFSISLYFSQVGIFLGSVARKQVQWPRSTFTLLLTMQDSRPTIEPFCFKKRCCLDVLNFLMLKAFAFYSTRHRWI